jgi:ribose/xylose/arabinose/galactoside ABC-type transport system permease subunit
VLVLQQGHHRRTQQVMVVGVIAIGQTLIILTAGIDLSCGMVMALGSIVMTKFAADLGVPAPASGSRQPVTKSPISRQKTFRCAISCLRSSRAARSTPWQRTIFFRSWCFRCFLASP